MEWDGTSEIIQRWFFTKRRTFNQHVFPEPLREKNSGKLISEKLFIEKRKLR